MGDLCDGLGVTSQDFEGDGFSSTPEEELLHGTDHLDAQVFNPRYLLDILSNHVGDLLDGAFALTLGHQLHADTSHVAPFLESKRRGYPLATLPNEGVVTFFFRYFPLEDFHNFLGHLFRVLEPGAFLHPEIDFHVAGVDARNKFRAGESQEVHGDTENDDTHENNEPAMGEREREYGSVDVLKKDQDFLTQRKEEGEEVFLPLLAALIEPCGTQHGGQC